MHETFVVSPIAVVHSCFKEKFGIPRQPGLVPEAKAVIELLPPFNVPEAVDGLALCSHIWVHFLFHANHRQSWKPKVKPPRLGGNKSMGVFATRSPVRPNPLGLSVVALEGVLLEYRGRAGVFLAIAAHDLLEGTPIVDIKPYLPYADALVGARNDFALASPELLDVGFADDVDRVLTHTPELKRLISQVLRQDPRPAYKKGHCEERIYGMRLNQWDVRWRYLTDVSGSQSILVTELVAHN